MFAVDLQKTHKNSKSMKATPKLLSLKWDDELYAYRLIKCKNGEKETIVMAKFGCGDTTVKTFYKQY